MLTDIPNIYYSAMLMNDSLDVHRKSDYRRYYYVENTGSKE